MSNAVALALASLPTMAIDKKGTKGSLALAMAFATRESRMAAGYGMYATWLQNGNFQAILVDTKAAALLNEVEFSLVEPMVKQGERVSRDQFIEFCTRVVKAIRAKNEAKIAKGKTVAEFKGKKAFVYAVIANVVKGSTEVGEVVEG